jgi:hypothetical protein
LLKDKVNEENENIKLNEIYTEKNIDIKTNKINESKLIIKPINLVNIDFESFGSGVFTHNKDNNTITKTGGNGWNLLIRSKQT